MGRKVAQDTQELARMQGERASLLGVRVEHLGPVLARRLGLAVARLARDGVELVERDVRRDLREVVPSSRRGVVGRVVGLPAAVEAGRELVGAPRESAQRAADVRRDEVGVRGHAALAQLVDMVEVEVKRLDEHAVGGRRQWRGPGPGTSTTTKIPPTGSRKEDRDRTHCAASGPSEMTAGSGVAESDDRCLRTTEIGTGSRTLSLS